MFVCVCAFVCVCVCVRACAHVCESDVSVSVFFIDLSHVSKTYAVHIHVSVSAFCANILATACVWFHVTAVFFKVLE